MSMHYDVIVLGAGASGLMLAAQAAVARAEGVVCHFLAHHLGKEFGHFHVLGFIVVEAVPGIIE